MAFITHIDVEPLSIELHQPFGIATGTQSRADNVLVRVTLDDDTVGLGEGAPFPAVNGETQEAALSALGAVAEHFVGRSVERWRALGHEISEHLQHCPSAACALQSATLDAWLRSHRCSMWHFYGGSEVSLESDITIPTGGVDQAVASTRDAVTLGFDVLKIKVGGAPLDLDVERLRAIAATAPHARLVLDANAAYSATEALKLLAEMGEARQRLTLFEQPTAREDLDGLRQVMLEGSVAVAADESARSAADVVRLARANAVSAINIKIMKSGLPEALDMIALARSHDLGLMVGGMVESDLAMSVSACLAAGQGGFRWVDLDTPLFMQNAPFTGGYARAGASLSVDVIEVGHGVAHTPESPT